MRVSQEIYDYVFVKLAILKNLLMTPDDLERIKASQDLDSLIEICKTFYPGLNPTEKTVVALEQSLWDIYFRIVEKIVYASPDPIQIFIHTMMLRFEIWNIKVIILSIIAQVQLDVKLNQVYRSAAQILGRENLLDSLLRAKTLDDVIHCVNKTQYMKIVKDGIAKYQASNEIFSLEQELDHYYFNNLISSLSNYPKLERSLIEQYLRANLDFYNLNLLYRTFFNQIPVKEIKDYLIPEGQYLKESEIKILYNSADLAEFINNLSQIFKRNRIIQDIIKDMKSKSLDAWENMQKHFLTLFNANVQQTYIGNIPYMSIVRIFNLLLNKEFEIRDIVARATQIQINALHGIK